MEDNKNRVYKTIMLVFLTAFVTFMITVFSMYTYFEKNMKIGKEDISALGKITENVNQSNLEKYLKRIRATIDKYYLWTDKISEEELETGAIEGYVAGLGDEYTEYIPADEMKEYTESITGNFVGIGVYIVADKEKGRAVIYYPIPESPAEKAGIEPGDVIISVDGTEYTIDDFENIANYIKGEEGTKVNIVVERNGERKTFEITRAKISTNIISSSIIENNIGYIKLPSFDEETTKNFQTKVDELKNQGAESLIIDLRNNGGGILQSAVDIADYLLDKEKVIISTIDNKDKKETTYSKNEPLYTMPIVVLVNQNSASAAEVLTCSLQDNKRATIVGKTTYGKGVIQALLSLQDGSGLKITTEEYYTPNGMQINKKGVTPDIEVDLSNKNDIYSVNTAEDTQLQKAIETLKKGE